MGDLSTVCQEITVKKCLVYLGWGGLALGSLCIIRGVFIEGEFLSVCSNKK